MDTANVLLLSIVLATIVSCDIYLGLMRANVVNSQSLVSSIYWCSIPWPPIPDHFLPVLPIGIQCTMPIKAIATLTFIDSTDDTVFCFYFTSWDNGAD